MFSQSGFSQTNNRSKIVDIVIHKVELGETIVMICKKYLVNPTTIYKSNKFIIDGVNEGMVLQIPVPRKEGQEYASVQYAEVDIDEDVVPMAIAEASVIVKEDPIAVKEKPIVAKKQPIVTKKQPVAVKDNPVAVKDEPVAVNNVEKDPVFESKKLGVSRIERDKETEYTIQDKETLFSISKKYDVAMDEIMERNEVVLKGGLVAGQVIIIPANKRILGFDNDVVKTDSDVKDTVNKAVVDVEKIEVKPVVVDQNQSDSDRFEDGFVIHKVQPKETLYSLSKKYFSTVEIIVANNDKIKKKGLGIGLIIKIPVSKTGKDIETGAVAELDKKINEFKAPVRTLNESDIIHKVQPNETITELAKKYGVSAYDIRSNNEKIMDKGLQVGQDIRIPKAATAIIAENDNLTPAKPIEIDDDAPIDKASNSDVYVVGDIITTVQPNESLEDIAKKYDVTVDEIIQNNRLLLKDRKIKVGQVIRVPAPKGSLEFSPETFD